MWLQKKVTVDSRLSVQGGQLVESPLCPNNEGELYTQHPRGKSVPWVGKTTLTLSSTNGLLGPF